MQISSASYLELSRSRSQRVLYHVAFSIQILDVHSFSTVFASYSKSGLHQPLESASFSRVLNLKTDKVDSRMIPVGLVIIDVEYNLAMPAH